MTMEIDRESDGRWSVEIPELPGVLAYGASRDEAVAHAENLALRVIADRKEHGEPIPERSVRSVISLP
jgi:predicted RNase H-like HicB family nuclease